MKIGQNIQQRLAREFQKIQESSLRRAEREEHRKYSRWPYRLAAAGLTAILVYSAYLVFDPGKKIYSMAELTKAGPGTYSLVTRGKIFRAQGNPPFSKIKESHDLVFNSKIERWPKAYELLSTGKDSLDFWYSFEIDLRNSPLAPLIAKEQIGVFIPKVLGQITVFRDGERFDFRPDYRLIIGLTRELCHLDIHVRGNPTDPRTPGINAFFPVLTGRFADLERITQFFESEAMRLPLAFVMQIVALLIICALASSGPYMAELWPAISFFSVNILDSGFIFLRDAGKLPFSLSVDQYYAIKTALCCAQGFAFLWFICEFFRMESRTIQSRLRKTLYAWCGFLAFAGVLAFKTIKGIDQPWIVLIVTNYLFFALGTAIASGREFFFVWNTRQTRERAILGSLILVSIFYFYGNGIYQYLHLTAQVTSEFAIQFNNYLVMAIITAVELGRSNRQRDEQRKHLPKEGTNPFTPNFYKENYRIHSGFVVLCDGVGYSVKLGQLKNHGPEERAHFQCSILHFLLERFYHPLTSNHAMTGDGFYFGVQWAWSEDNLRRILQKCKDTVDSEMALSTYGLHWFGNDKMRFRCNLAYGEYSNTQVTVNTLGAVVASSDLHTYLARTSGSKDDPIVLRVFLNSYTQGFASLPFGKIIQSKNKSADEQLSEAMEFTSIDIDRILAEGWLQQIVRSAKHREELNSAA